VVSCVLHAVLLAFIIIGWTPAEKPQEAVRPRYIQAELLQMKPAASQSSRPKPQPEPVAKPQPAPEPAPPPPAPEPKVDEQAIKKVEEQKRQEAEKREQQAKAQAEQKRQEAVKKEQLAKAEAEKKRQQEVAKAEAEKKRQQEQAKAEAEKKRQEAEKAEKARQEQKQKELERQEQLKREQAEKSRRQELANALAMEDDLLEAEDNAAQVGTYVDYMGSLIAANWSRPPSARRGMEVMLEISLGSAGMVTSVRVVKSSGNAAFDLSAEQAVKKVGQFSRLREMDPMVYQRDFRRIKILFRPDDLRM